MAVKDIIDKLSSYNLFNYLFPGFLFVIILSYTTELIPSVIEYDVSNIILIYFIGLGISRIGSVVLEEVLKSGMHIGKIDMPKLMQQLKDNLKFEAVFEAMNMYRTLAAMLILLGILSIIDLLMNNTYWLLSIITIISEFSLSVLFTIGYCKQRKKVLECLPDYEDQAKSLFKRKKTHKNK